MKETQKLANARRSEDLRNLISELRARTLSDKNKKIYDMHARRDYNKDQSRIDLSKEYFSKELREQTNKDLSNPNPEE